MNEYAPKFIYEDEKQFECNPIHLAQRLRIPATLTPPLFNRLILPIEVKKVK
jgi:hypothetical protein